MLTCGAAEWAPDLPNGALYRMPASEAVGGWTLDGVAIAGATGATHTAQSGGEYRCTRTATNFAGTTIAQSAPFTVAPPATPPPPPPPPPAPPAAAGVPKLTPAATRVAVSTSGDVLVAVQCSVARCAGTLGLTTDRALAAGAAGRKLAAGATLGAASLTVAAGTRATVRIKLGASGRQLASRHASIPARATATLTGAAASTTALTLKPAQAPAITPASASTTMRLSRVTVRLRCGAARGKTCRGTLALTARLGGRTVTIARRTLALRGTKTSNVSLTLSASARAAILRRSLKATQTATSTVTVGLATRRTGALRVSAL